MPRCAVSAVILVFAVASLAAQRGPSTLEPIALINASVINIRSGSVQRGTTVVLRGGQIESVGTGAVPAGARTIDLRKRYVLPGPIDSHVHTSPVSPCS